VHATRAGAFYALVVFGVGFILGAIRVLLLVPRLGDTTAVVLEAPLMLVASWFVCRWVIERLNMRRAVPARSMMGVAAFIVLMLAEFALGAAVFGRSWFEQLASYATVAGAIGLVAQVTFALFPVVQVWLR